MNKCILTIFLLFWGLCGWSRNYYISSGGNDGTGTGTQAAPWQSISHVNTISNTFLPGDSILFKRGEIFFGGLVITKSGVSGSPIVIGAYGTGARPVITALVTVTSWSLLSTGIYRASLPAKNSLNLVTVDGAPAYVGRYPNPDAANHGYLILESFSGTTSITDNDLPASPNWTGAEMTLMVKNWWIEKTKVVSHSGGTLTYTPSGTSFNSSEAGYTLITPDNGRAYFIQRDPRTLDQLKEWYYDTTGHFLQMYFGANNPASYTVKASVLDTLVNAVGRTYITISDISFEGANSMAVCMKDANNLNVFNSDFTNMGSRGVFVWNTNDIVIDNCTFTDVLSSAIDITNRHRDNVAIRNCTLKRIGIYPGMGQQWSDNDGKSILAVVDHNLTIEQNQLDTIGFVGIQFQGNNALIQNNYINYFNFVKDDDGGIYTYQSGTDAAPGVAYTNRTIRNNIVLNGVGVSVGAFATDCEAIYLDGRSGNVNIYGNSTAFTANHGLYANNPNSVYFRNNTSFNNALGIGFARYTYSADLPDFHVKSNIFFSTTATGGAQEYSNGGINTPVPRTLQSWMQTGMGFIDSNVHHYRYAAPYKYLYYTADNGTLFFNPSPLHSVNGWLNFTGNKDLNSKYIPTIPYYTLNSLVGPSTIGNGFYEASIAGTNVSGSGAVGTWDQTGKVTGPGSLKIVFPANTGNLVFTNLIANVGAVDVAKKYIVRFATKGTNTVGGFARMWLKRASGTIISDTQYVSFETNIVNHEKAFTIAITDAAAQIVIQFEQGSGTFYFDNFAFYEANVTLTNYNTRVTFEYNNTNDPKIISFPGRTKTDPRDTVYNNGAVVYPWTSKIFIDNGAVTAPNVSPTADAGVNIVITLPTNSTSVTGHGTDVDGTIAGYGWVKLSGPPGGIFSTPSAATSVITGLQQGVYQMQLTVTDNQGATGTDIVQITVNAAPNIAPTVDAGANKVIQLPVNSTSVTATAADVDGTIASVLWTKTSGPSTFTINTPGSLTTVFSGLVPGIYIFTVTVTDDDGATASSTVQVTVNPAANTAPTVDAGLNKVITLPTNSVSVTATAADVDGTIASVLWTKTAGPATFTIVSPTALITSFSNLVAGVYQFTVTVTDDDGATASSSVQVTVNPAPNIAPTVDAGTNKVITLPTNSVAMTGTAADVDGTIASVLWTKTAGPATFTIVTPGSLTTTINNLVAGVYQFSVTVTDDDGATATSTVQVTVNAAPPVNIAPTVDAGSNITITLPTNSTAVHATAADVDGTIAAISWVKTSGPGAGTIISPTAATTGLSGLVQGVYLFTVTVTDNNGATASDMVTVTVNPKPIIAPTVDAGANVTMTLPTNSTTVHATAADVDGTIASYLWIKASGPGTFTIISPTAATTVINNLVEGVYQFVVTVTDNDGATASDVVIITVNHELNIAPTVDAGVNIVITLPTNTASVHATAADVDGTIASYVWVKTSGPGTPVILTPGAATTGITGLVQGTYQFTVTVTDDAGATASDIVIITVNRAPNQPPSVEAGANIQITLPVNNTSFAATITDDGSISSILWTKTAGPATYTIGTPTAATTTITNLVQGTYQFTITVTDNDGAVSTDVIQVIVLPQPPNSNPVAYVGSDVILMTLPVNSTTLVGYGVDADGTIASVQWTILSGPGTGTIVSPTIGTTLFNNLVAGVYQLRFTVTDDRGGTGSRTVQVTVLPAVVPPPANTILLRGYTPKAN